VKSNHCLEVQLSMHSRADEMINRTEFGATHESGIGPGCSLIPGLRSRLSKHILAGFMVLSAVGACPPHNGVG
jgi:hypothetical protein